MQAGGVGVNKLDFDHKTEKEICIGNLSEHRASAMIEICLGGIGYVE